MLNILKNKAGYTFLELAVIGTVGGTALLAMTTAQGLLAKQAGNMNIVADSIAEHQSINNLITGIPLRQALSVFCLPHPWGYYTKNSRGSDACVDLQGATAWPNRTDGMPGPGRYRNVEWSQLSQAYQMFSRGMKPGNGLAPLGGKYLTEETLFWESNAGMVPLLERAGCLRCHDGSYNGLRNFRQYSQMLQSPSLVSLYGLGSAMGRYLIPTTQSQIISGGRDSLPEELVKREHKIEFFREYASISTGATASTSFKCQPMLLTGSRHAGGCGNFAGACPANCFYRQSGGCYQQCAGGKKEGVNCTSYQYYKCLCPNPEFTPPNLPCDSGYIYNGVYLSSVQSGPEFNLCRSISNLSSAAGYSYWECRSVDSEAVYTIDPNTNEPILTTQDRTLTQNRWKIDYRITTRWWTRTSTSEPFSDYDPDSNKPAPNRVISFGALK